MMATSLQNMSFAKKYAISQYNTLIKKGIYNLSLLASYTKLMRNCWSEPIVFYQAQKTWTRKKFILTFHSLYGV